MPGIDIDIVSDGPDDSGSHLSQSVLQGLRASLPNAIVARNVLDMIMQMLSRLSRAAADSRSLRRIRIYGHGTPGQCFIGSGRNYPTEEQTLGANDQGLMFNATDLRRIRGLFDSDALVTVHGCNFAQGKIGITALRELSSLWSVRVMASAAAQWSSSAGNSTVTQLQPPILTAHNISPHAVPETPLPNPWSY